MPQRLTWSTFIFTLILYTTTPREWNTWSIEAVSCITVNHQICARVPSCWQTRHSQSIHSCLCLPRPRCPGWIWLFWVNQWVMTANLMFRQFLKDADKKPSHINLLLSDRLPDEPHHQSQLSAVDVTVPILKHDSVTIGKKKKNIFTFDLTIVIIIFTNIIQSPTILNRPHQRRKMRRRSRLPSSALCASLSSAAKGKFQISYFLVAGEH